MNWTLTQLTKLYEQQPQLIDKALAQLLQNNHDLSWSLVVNAYLDEEINLGKAAELLDLHELELRQRFMELGIPLRVGASTVAEAEAEIQALEMWFKTE